MHLWDFVDSSGHCTKGLHLNVLLERTSLSAAFKGDEVELFWMQGE
jgi:hypothetical protein